MNSGEHAAYQKPGILRRFFGLLAWTGFVALLSWLIFAALMWGRWRHGWRGRLAVRWTLAGFVLLLLAYVGSKFVLEVLLHRMG